MEETEKNKDMIQECAELEADIKSRNQVYEVCLCPGGYLLMGVLTTLFTGCAKGGS